ncbi:putative bifunctional diguanylate cyclase/phosphodiesterase, partial [Sphaerotilus natans]
ALLRMPELDRRILLQALDDSRHQSAPLTPDLPLRLARGPGQADRSLLASIQPLPVPRDDQLVLVLTDLSEVMSARRQIEHDRQHDRLTGLPERRLFIEQLAQQLGPVADDGDGPALALLFIDIDRFARIGDHLGHAQADEVLQRLARRLQDSCHRSELLARWGGDQFVMLLRQAGDPDAALARARELLQRVSPDIEVGGLALGLGASIGVACAPRDGRDADTLLMRARTAMGRAKTAGGHRVASGGADPAPPPDPRQLGLETRLRQAIEDDEFVLHYQLQFALDDGRPVGAEALLRWPREDGQWLPGRFIGLIDEGGMTVALGERVIVQAIAQLRRWREAGLAPVPVSVNISPRQCLDDRLPELVAERLAQEQVPAALLKIEITESAAMHDPQHLRGLLERLRAMGVQIALDDFGTGYSSLAHLRDMPVDQIKIDPGFVGSMEQHAGSRAIVEATIALAHGLKVPVVAEGVESARQLELLRSLGCDQVQGFLLAHPLPPDALAERLRDGSSASDHISRCSPALSPPRIT